MTTSIEWTDRTWNPVIGCTRVSKGCENCYAERMARRLAAMGQADYATVVTGKRWNGRIVVRAAKLTEPLRWRKPCRVFVNSMGDLLHPGVSSETLDQCFAVMAICPHHEFQILTKHGADGSLDRMREYMRALVAGQRSLGDALRAMGEDRLSTRILLARAYGVEAFLGASGAPPYRPFSNVQILVSAEDQPSWDARVPLLLDTPAAVRGVSLEPLIGPVDVTRTARFAELDWVIVGGESGPGARPMHPDWVRGVRDACVGSGVAFFFKQWGAYTPVTQACEAMTIPIKSMKRWVALNRDGHLLDKKSATLDQTEMMIRVGKKKAGRFLDGRVWEEWPQAPGTQRREAE